MSKSKKNAFQPSVKAPPLLFNALKSTQSCTTKGTPATSFSTTGDSHLSYSSSVLGATSSGTASTLSPQGHASTITSASASVLTPARNSTTGTLGIKSTSSVNDVSTGSSRNLNAEDKWRSSPSSTSGLKLRPLSSSHTGRRRLDTAATTAGGVVKSSASPNASPSNAGYPNAPKVLSKPWAQAVAESLKNNSNAGVGDSYDQISEDDGDSDLSKMAESHIGASKPVSSTPQKKPGAKTLQSLGEVGNWDEETEEDIDFSTGVVEFADGTSVKIGRDKLRESPPPSPKKQESKVPSISQDKSSENEDKHTMSKDRESQSGRKADNAYHTHTQPREENNDQYRSKSRYQDLEGRSRYESRDGSAGAYNDRDNYHRGHGRYNDDFQQAQRRYPRRNSFGRGDGYEHRDGWDRRNRRDNFSSNDRMDNDPFRERGGYREDNRRYPDRRQRSIDASRQEPRPEASENNGRQYRIRSQSRNRDSGETNFISHTKERITILSRGPPRGEVKEAENEEAPKSDGKDLPKDSQLGSSKAGQRREGDEDRAWVSKDHQNDSNARSRNRGGSSRSRSRNPEFRRRRGSNADRYQNRSEPPKKDESQGVSHDSQRPYFKSKHQRGSSPSNHCATSTTRSAADLAVSWRRREPPNPTPADEIKKPADSVDNNAKSQKSSDAELVSNLQSMCKIDEDSDVLSSSVIKEKRSNTTDENTMSAPPFKSFSKTNYHTQSNSIDHKLLKPSEKSSGSSPSRKQSISDVLSGSNAPILPQTMVADILGDKTHHRGSMSGPHISNHISISSASGVLANRSNTCYSAETITGSSTFVESRGDVGLATEKNKKSDPLSKLSHDHSRSRSATSNVESGSRESDSNIASSSSAGHHSNVGPTGNYHGLARADPHDRLNIHGNQNPQWSPSYNVSSSIAVAKQHFGSQQLPLANSGKNINFYSSPHSTPGGHWTSQQHSRHQTPAFAPFGPPTHAQDDSRQTAALPWNVRQLSESNQPRNATFSPPFTQPRDGIYGSSDSILSGPVSTTRPQYGQNHVGYNNNNSGTFNIPGVQHEGKGPSSNARDVGLYHGPISRPEFGSHHNRHTKTGYQPHGHHQQESGGYNRGRRPSRGSSHNDEFGRDPYMGHRSPGRPIPDNSSQISQQDTHLHGANPALGSGGGRNRNRTNSVRSSDRGSGGNITPTPPFGPTMGPHNMLQGAGANLPPQHPHHHVNHSQGYMPSSSLRPKIPPPYNGFQQYPAPYLGSPSNVMVPQTVGFSQPIVGGMPIHTHPVASPYGANRPQHHPHQISHVYHPMQQQMAGYPMGTPPPPPHNIHQGYIRPPMAPMTPQPIMGQYSPLLSTTTSVPPQGSVVNPGNNSPMAIISGVQYTENAPNMPNPNKPDAAPISVAQTNSNIRSSTSDPPPNVPKNVVAKSLAPKGSLPENDAGKGKEEVTKESAAPNQLLIHSTKGTEKSTKGDNNKANALDKEVKESLESRTDHVDKTEPRIANSEKGTTMVAEEKTKPEPNSKSTKGDQKSEGPIGESPSHIPNHHHRGRGGRGRGGGNRGRGRGRGHHKGPSDYAQKPIRDNNDGSPPAATKTRAKDEYHGRGHHHRRGNRDRSISQSGRGRRPSRPNNRKDVPELQEKYKSVATHKQPGGNARSETVEAKKTVVEGSK
ncbi:hypothetical protein H4219_001893 [Mycoemilia scoparia]|uniref:Uncharacterized protein n=1 Tax=Mycoemilia scoparia TaxID=417184 RepID=A0A9W7ZZ45_9FUNG|nr:hypothetical protein H4219_001893 [Mycoemilia scoparia]